MSVQSQDLLNGLDGVIKSTHSLEGYAYGFRTACLTAEFYSERLPKFLSSAFGESIRECLLSQDPSCAVVLDSTSAPSGVPDQLAYWLYFFLRIANVPQAECGHEVSSYMNEVRKIVVPAPVAAHALLSRMLRWLIRLSAQSDATDIRTTLDLDLPRGLAGLKELVPAASNIPRFVEAAVQLDIPVEEVAGRVLQFGQGRKARWLDSSFTDQTPKIGASIARNKQWASRVLFDAGLPVAPHAIVANHQQALKAARKIGYPVVIKPADLDGGIAVAAGLMKDEEVLFAFDRVIKYSNTVMLEKHIPGRDYRLNVFSGELLWAIERVPAGVTGDGRHSVRELLDSLNADSRRGDGIHVPLKKILLDDEAIELLQSVGKRPDSVLSPGEFLPLRRRANVAAGALPVPVTDKVHPDNARLAVRAAAALGLDIAGVDFITTDISLSWTEVGGAICEINAQPQLGSVTSMHVYPQILHNLLKGNGRIPITVVLGAPDGKAAESAAASYASAGYCVGYAGRRGIFVGDQCISKKPLSPYRAGKALLRDRNVGAIVLEINDFSVLKTGMPFDRIDHLETFGPNTCLVGAIPDGLTAKPIKMLMDMIAPESLDE